ncbi:MULTISPECIES: GerW family sporulation protein [unclassified Bacillus (in: firmicutes)]|uniref:GerW family sporulation protein n=1 Tax=unclassified Bacillus (in: firmicutes) TaxID=185979 RepID=UPI0008E4BE25|nr:MULTISPECIES: GerW family sporulation protein [unclassified Bacillus (in: firmicutes)]SFI95498.1 sporulation protein YtfJ [Bacillus sp. 71mf]SFS64537.1 sporulation protein YtfJ [Bacillus sp. 103mf]
MTQHPIENLMKTAMANLKEMVDVNTIVGKPVSTADGSIILTVSKVSFGFGAGGSDFNVNGQKTEAQSLHPFGGGSGAGVSINPVAFLVVGAKGVQVMHLHSGTHLVEKALETVPNAVQRLVNKP